MTTAFDHALAFVLVVVAPLNAWRDGRRLVRAVESGDDLARIRPYRMTVIAAWTLTLTVLIWWRIAGRPFDAMGVIWPAGAAAWITVALCLATLMFFALQIRSVLTSAAARASVRAQLSASRGVEAVVPESARDLRVFAALGITAGICEEVLYRGYLVWYLSALLPTRAALIAAVAIFGLGHVYQGVRGVLLTAAVGGLELAIYLWTGSLVAPIVLHATMDLANGYIGYRARQPEPLGSTPAPGDVGS
jgi:membrane protease YdiL (CAAX protease family)